MTTPYPVVRNRGDSGSFFASQQQNPSGANLITGQADPRSPQVSSFDRISDPIIPSADATQYVKNFDPDLYDLRDTSHLMRLIRAFTGPSGTGGLRKQNIVARLSSLLADGAFLDLDKFYGALFNLQRHDIEAFPQNLDGTTINPYTDMANSDLWDAIMSSDARYRSRIYQLVQAVNMGTTYPGLKAAAQAVVSCDVDLIESWTVADLVKNEGTVQFPVAKTFYSIESQYVKYGQIKGSYGLLSGTKFASGQLPLGTRSELICVPQRVISAEEQYQLSQVLNTLKPSNVMVTIAAAKVENSSNVPARVFASDSENWQIQARVTPAVGLINPTVPIYNNAGPYSLARPAFSEYSGERWSYNPNVSRTDSYQRNGDFKTIPNNEETIVYRGGNYHTYAASDSVMDTRQAIAKRLSAQGVVTNFPYSAQRANFTSTG